MSTHVFKIEEAPGLTLRVYVKSGVQFLCSDGSLENYDLDNIEDYAFTCTETDGANTTGAYTSAVADPLTIGVYEFFYCYGTGPTANAGDMREKRK